MKTLFIFLFISLFSTPLFPQVSINIGNQKEFIIPLELNNASFADLNPLKPVFLSKQLIGMGEATHGTKEFFEVKAKVFKFLVTNCNYRVFGIEASYGGCSYINDFVRSGKGNIDSVLLNFDFWTWRTEEVKSLILWIKDYNLSKDDSEKVSFYGFDMQNFYSPIQYFNSFFKLDKKLNTPKLKNITDPLLRKTEFEIYRQLQKKELNYQDSLVLIYQSAKKWLLNNKEMIESTYTTLQFQRLDFCIENFHQAVLNLNPKQSANYRDSCMANNILQIQQLENAKMFVWAHNGHINLTYPEKVSGLMGLPMGGYLKNKLKENYYAIGFVFNEGSFQAIKGPNSVADALFKYTFNKQKLYAGLMKCTVPINEANTFTNALAGIGYASFLVDLTPTKNLLFTSTLKTYDIGAVFLNYKRSSDEINAKKQFNGIVYIAKTTSAIPLKFSTVKH